MAVFMMKKKKKSEQHITRVKYICRKCKHAEPETLGNIISYEISKTFMLITFGALLFIIFCIIFDIDKFKKDIDKQSNYCSELISALEYFSLKDIMDIKEPQYNLFYFNSNWELKFRNEAS